MSNTGSVNMPGAEFQLEDKALKTAAQYFGSELLPLWGIPGRVKGIAPTEQIHLEVARFTEDFNYEMEDGSWVHLEFESDSITVKDLRRFRVYEAYISYQYGVTVTTYVVCSSNVKRIKSELREGLNTYRVHIVRMQDTDGDPIIRDLEEKQKQGIGLKKEELVSLILTPLMSGKLMQKERIGKGLQILQKEYDTVNINREELQCMQAVLYAFAAKFLSKMELEDIKEVMTMTVLGQMLMNEGLEKGMERGMERGMEKGMERGIEYGEDRMTTLIAKLTLDNRIEDIKRIGGNPECRKELFKEYNI